MFLDTNYIFTSLIIYSAFIIILYSPLDEESHMDMYSKRMKTNNQNQNHVLRCQMPDLIKDAYDFDENNSTNSSSATCQNELVMQ